MAVSLLKIGKRTPIPIGLTRRIYWSVSSEGYGHSSRAIALAREFDSTEVLIGTYSYALDRVRQLGLPHVSIPQELELVGSAGSFDVGKTIFQNRSKPLELNLIIQEEMDIMKTYGVSLVVADGRIAPVLAAARLDIPCLVMTNQSAFYPFFEKDSPLVQWFGRSFEWVMKLWLCSAEEILIPDFPPPDTICLPNLSEKFQVKKRTRFIGPLVSWNPDEIIPIDRPEAGSVVVVCLGGHAYRRPLFDAVLTMAQQTPEIHYHLLTSFTASHVPANVEIHQHVQESAPFFKAADLVITQGGHSTAMELLTLGKPSLVVPDRNQREQENNADRLAFFGVSRKVTYDEVETSVQHLKNAMMDMLKSPEYQTRAQGFAEKATALHDAHYGANVVREYANRLLAY